MRGIYPGTFDPPTVAHLAIADAAIRQAGLDALDLAVSAVAIGKEHVDDPQGRVERLRRLGFDAVVTEHRLIADIAAGYDALVLGADKWAQVVDPAFYGGSTVDRDAAVRRLPRLLVVAPRPPWPVPDGAVVLDLPPWLADVSSTAVRAGRVEWAAAEP